MKVCSGLRGLSRQWQPKDGWAPWFFIAAFAVSLSAIDLTDVRRPFHDTAATFYYRIFSIDAMRLYSIPFWYPYMKWSFPVASLENSVVWSIPGHLIGIVMKYDLFQWAIENLIWNFTSTIGMFMFARRHVLLSWTAIAIGISYSASGLIIGTLPVIGTTRALQIGPWVFYAIDVVIDGGVKGDWRSWRRGGGLLAACATLWATSAYPGIWLTSPFLLAPYVFVRTWGSFRQSVRMMSAATVAAVLSLGMCIILVDGSVNTPLFGAAAARPYVSPWDGVFQPRDAGYLFLPNPGYLRDPNAGFEPLYLGILVPISLLVFRPLSKSNKIQQDIYKYSIYMSVVILAGHALIQMASGPLSFSTTLAVALACVSGAGISMRRYDRVDAALLTTLLASIIMSTDNTISNIFRIYVPPFTFLRWNSWYLWTGMVCGVVYAWRNIEAWVLSEPQIAEGRALHRHTSSALVVVGGSALMIAISYKPSALGSGEMFRQMHQLTADYLMLAVPLTVLGMACTIFAVWFGWVTAETGTTSFAVILAGGLLLVGTHVVSVAGGADAAHRTALPLAVGVPEMLDVMQIVGMCCASWLVAWFGRRRLPGERRLALLAVVVAVDMSMAAPRYLSQTDYLISGQVSRPTLIDRAFSFSGNRRVRADGLGCSGPFFENALSRVPNQVFPCSAPPQLVDRELASGDRSVYGSFVHFPLWWVARTDGQMLAGLPGDSATPASTAPDGASMPDCPDGVAEGSFTEGEVTKLLPDRVRLRIRSNCSRLVVLADTWAPGWSVTVDGYSQTARRVNGSLRGVEVSAGEHDVEWFYRPPNWQVLVAVTVFAIVSMITLLMM